MMFAVLRETREYRIVPLSVGVFEQVAAELLEQADALVSDRLTHIDFEPGYRPEPGEVSTINDYALPTELTALLCPTAQHATLDDQALADGEVSALLAHIQIDNGVLWVGQVRARHQVLETGRLSLRWRDNQYVRMDATALTFGTKADVAVCDGTLYFTSFQRARRVLPLDELGIEASDTQVQTFIELERVKVKDEAKFRATLDSVIRRQIAAILRSEAYMQADWSVVQSAAKSLGLDSVQFASDGSEAIVLPSEKPALKEVLAFMNQDVFTGVLNAETYRTNSKRKV